MKSMILMIALPVACLASGYGAGMFLVPGEETRIASAEPTVLSDAAPGQPGEQDALRLPPAPKDPNGDPAAADGKKDAAGKDGYGKGEDISAKLLEIGRLTVPVLKPRSITYVVADISLALPEAALVAKVEESPEHLLRMRDAVLAALTEAAGTPAMSGPAIDTEALSLRVLDHLKAIGMPVDEVLFPNLFKQDVARQDIPQRHAAATSNPHPETAAVTH